MPNYNIRIIVEGVDRASAPLRNIGSALGNMGTIAGGILGAGLFMKIADGIGGIIRNSIMATAGLESMQVSMEGLLAREIATANNTVLMSDNIDDATQSIMTISDALPQAGSAAKAMMDELAKIAILSPYQLSAVQSTFQMALAFGYTSGEAKDFTKAVLNLGAAVGADNERLQRIVYNFAQMRMAGRITALDVRQLAMAGFDLRSVLGYVSDQLGLNIKDHNDFNAALESGQVTWEEFNKLFVKYADENFGGAAERMSRTLMGLQSTMKDVFTLTMPAILAPAVSRFTEFANGILNNFLKLRDSPALPAIGEKLGAFMDKIFDGLDPVVGAMEIFFDTIARGVSPVGALGAAINGALGFNAWQTFINITMAIRKFWAATEKLRKGIARIVTTIANFLTKNVKIKDVLITLGIFIASILIPQLLALGGAFISFISPILLVLGAVVLFRKAWETNFMGIRDKLQAFGANLLGVYNQFIAPFFQNVKYVFDAIMEAGIFSPEAKEALGNLLGDNETAYRIIDTLQRIYNWLGLNIPLAIQWLTTTWNTVLLPALISFGAWVQTSLIPFLQQIWAWLQVNIPIAIAWLTNAWNTVLLPAIQAVASWITGTLIPVLSQIWAWLSTNIPMAIGIIGQYLGVLIQYWTMFWEYISGTVIPLFMAIARVIGSIVGLAIRVLIGIVWQLLTPFRAVWNFISTLLAPVFDKLKEKSGGVKGVLEKFSEFLSGTLKPAFDKIHEVVSKVIEWLGKLADKISNIKLPGWLTPGSPTPFEMGLRGIADAMGELSRVELPTLKANLDIPKNGLNIGNRGENLANSQPIVIQITGNTIASSVDIEEMASKIARKIQNKQRSFSY